MVRDKTKKNTHVFLGVYTCKLLQGNPKGEIGLWCL